VYQALKRVAEGEYPNDMKRIVVILVLLIAQIVGNNQPAFSDFSLQNCLTFRNIVTSVDGKNIVVTAQAVQTCSEFTSPNFDGFQPRYSISNLGVFCSGPALYTGRQTFYPFVLGSVRCSGTSEKYGTTSSTLEARLGYINFNENTTSVNFSHPEIVKASLLSNCV
jgi:hypothetical protein